MRKEDYNDNFRLTWKSCRLSEGFSQIMWKNSQACFTFQTDQASNIFQLKIKETIPIGALP